MSAGALESDLRAALEAAVVGEPVGPHLIGRAQTVARALLLRRGLGAARVQARLEGASISVRVDLPPGRARVRTIQITLA